MREQNPFKLRYVEEIDNNAQFLKLFGPSILSILPEDCLMNKGTILTSAPGGGKTSLLRIFKPESLLEIINYKDRDDYSDLSNILQNMGVIGSRPKLLGVYLSCARNYSDLENLQLDAVQKNKLFFSLMIARIIVIAIQSISELYNLTLNDLAKIYFERPKQAETLPKSPFPCDGKTLYDWAIKIEMGIYEILDSYDHIYDKELAFTDNADFLHVLNPSNIKIEGHETFSKTLIMLDDVSFLNNAQIEQLFSILKKHQTPLPIWIATRKEAFEFNDLLPGNIGREFSRIEIEDNLKKKGLPQFASFVKNIADRRIKTGTMEIDNFSSHLDDNLDTTFYQDRFKKIIAEIRERIGNEAKSTRKFDDWILKQEQKQGTFYEKSVGWRTLEIQIQRNTSGLQTELFDFPLDPDLLSKSSSAIAPAAELFLCKEFSIPYLYGMQTLAYLASYNIEQFLELSSHLFETLISKYRSKESLTLSPKEQSDILKKVATAYWNDIPHAIPHGVYAAQLLGKMCSFAKDQTYRPTAPYLPGVTAFAISRQNYYRISDPASFTSKPQYKILKDTIHSCIANNVLYPEYDYRQGPKGKTTYVVFYFNRLLCAHFDLPYGYGGWRRTDPDEMCNWLELQSSTKGNRTNC